MKHVVMLGGPNGAGKTTASRTLLPKDLGIREFVNADEIARGLSPYNSEANAVAAARVMIGRIEALIETGSDFAFETTCAGRGYVRLLETCRAAGYRITLIFLWLPSPEIALARVGKRVREGGHSIPDKTVIRRFHAGLQNMRHLYLPLADIASIYDNSATSPILIAGRVSDAPLAVYDHMRWTQIEAATP